MSDSPKLTCDELIRTELSGKARAIEQYDSILWKIRSGYVVVLYGGLAILGTAGLNISTILGSTRLLRAALILIWGFSLCGFLVDFDFSRRKLRVVEASNQLYALALQISLGIAECNEVYSTLVKLLRNAGESSTKVPCQQIRDHVVYIVPLYFAAAIVGTFIYITAP